MDDLEVNTAIDTLLHSDNVQEMQTALMTFAVRIDANSCSQQLRERLWKAISANAKFWKLFLEEKDPTLPQLAAHTLAAFAGDDFFLSWLQLRDILPRLSCRLKDVNSKNDILAVESFSKDILIICLSCARDSSFALPVANALLQASKVLPSSCFVSTPQFFQYASDIVRFLVLSDKWYRDGTVRSAFTWAVNLGITLFISDQSAGKFEFARLTGAILLNAAPPASAKHRNVVIDAFLPESFKISLADNTRSVFLSRALTVSKRHVAAILVFTAGLQRWLCGGDGDFWLFSFKSNIFKTQEEFDKIVPMLAVHCSAEFVRITREQEGHKINSEDDQTLAASLQLMEDLLELLLLRSEEASSLPENKAMSSSVILESHRCLREAAVSSMERLADAEFEQPDSSGIYSETGGIKLACFRWSCRFVAQDAASIDGDLLAVLVRYGVNGLSTVSSVTIHLIPMFAAALGNLLSLSDSGKDNEVVRRCFIDNNSNAGTCLDTILQLVDGTWRQTAVNVDSNEGNELLSSIKDALLKLKSSTSS